MCPHRQHMCVCVFMCLRSQKTRKELGVCSALSTSSLLFPWDRSIEPRFTLVSTESKTSFFLCPCKALEFKTGHNTWVFIWVLEIWTQVLPPGCTTNVHLHWTTSLYFQRWWCYYYYNSFHRTPLITAEGQGSGSATQKPPSPSLFKVIL